MSNITIQQQRTSIRTTLEKMRPEFEKVLGKTDPERFLRIALTAINKTPKLLECTESSLLACIMDLAQLKLEPDSARGLAYLIPYGRECTLQIGYKGFAELIYRSGNVERITCQVVYANDQFDYQYGLEEKLVHKPTLGERGAKIAAYSFVKFKDGGFSFLVMNMEELKAIKAKVKGGSPAWKEFEDEMIKKSVFRRHVKLLPIDLEIRELLDKDAEVDFDLSQSIPQTTTINGTTRPDISSASVADTGKVEDAEFAEVEAPKMSESEMKAQEEFEATFGK